VTEDAPIKPKKRKSRRRRILISLCSFLVAVCIAFAGFYFANHRKQPDQTKLLQGRISLTERGLRDVVLKNNLIAYWIGPLAGDSYSIYVPRPGVAVVRYIPAGASVVDASPDFRLVAAYVQKDAFATTQAGGLKPGNLGFVNIDGNAVFYVKTRPTNVFVGIKGKDVQLEIFDPGQDQAVALALFRGQIQQIK
jgi:hypothetical protein